MSSAAHVPASEPTVILGATLIDGTGRDPVSNAAIVVEAGRIRAVGARTSVTLPQGAAVIEAEGMTLLPGLIDCHVHLAMRAGMALADRVMTPPSLNLLYAVPNSRATLEAGITTVRDAGGTPAGVKMAVERGLFPGPRMLVAITILSQTGGHADGYMPSCVDLRLGHFPDVPHSVVDGVDEMRKKVREILRAGADWIKLCTSGGVLSTADDPASPQFTVEEISAAVYEASTHFKRAMAHAQSTIGIKNALKAGIASIEHGIWLDDEAIDMMKARGVYLVPTLVAPRDVITFAEANPGALPEVVVNKARSVVADHSASIRKAIQAGVKVAMGTDSGVGPHGRNARELGLMVEHGMTPMQSIVASTSEAAKLLHLDNEVGTLEEGKLADLLLVEGNLLANITAVEDQSKLALVMKGGQIVKSRMEVSKRPTVASI
jgi:imidazolonepropionase-like amidohydrolase